MGFFDNPVKDAKKIHDTIDYRVLRAAWDGYVRSKKKDFKKSHGAATPAWFALFAIQNYKGNFNKFDVEELPQLQSFVSVHEVYEEIKAELASHTNDQKFAEYLLETHPDLHDAVPSGKDSIDQIDQYIIDVLSRYQEMLEKFYKKYQKQIDGAIAKLQKQAG